MSVPELYILIHNLSATEKAYFKKYAYKNKNKSSNAYFLLFDILSKQKEYDEDALKLKLKKTTLDQKLSQAKNYLFELIITTFTTPLSIGANATSFDIDFNQIKFLIDRNVLKQAQKKLDKIKKNILEVEALEYFPLYFELYNKLLSYNKEDQIARTTLNKSYKEILEKLENIRVYENLKNKSFDLKRNKEILYIRKKEDKEIINHIKQEDWLNNEKLALTIRSKLLFYFIRNQVWLMSSEIETAYKETFIQYELFLNNKAFAQYHILDYIKVMSNLVRRMQNTNNFKHFNEVKNNILTALKHINNNVFVRTKQFELMYVDRNRNIDSFHFDKIKPIIPEFIFVYKNYYQNRKDTLIAICNDIALTYFYIDDFENALDYINQLLNDPYLKYSKDLESYGYIIRQIILIELNLFSDYGNEFYNIKKKLYRDNKLYKVENKILDLLDKYALTNNFNERKAILTSYQTEILTLLKNPLHQNFLKYFQIDWWITAKLHDKTIYQYYNKY